jgi:hypothetical protein
MMRLLTTLVLVVALLAALDRFVASLATPDTETRSIDIERHEQFRHAIAMQFDELRVDVGRLATAGHVRWDALPDRKGPDELRIVIIGNSSAMFSLAPSVVEERLAAGFPTRNVTVTPLLLPGVQVVDEEILVRAALAKHADVIIITPNLQELVAGRGGLSGPVLKLFGERAGLGRWIDPSAIVDDLLESHWRLYRDRELLRTRLVDALSRRLSWHDDAERSRRDADATFAAISAAAASGSVHDLVETYRSHGMGAFLGGPIFRNRLQPLSPVFATVTKLATSVRQGGALGIAIFMPVHPLFRDAAATADFPDLHVDDAYVQALATRILGIYDAAGFTTFNRVNALPGSAFIDLIHVNADGMESFSLEMAQALTETLQGALPPE